MHLDYLFLPKEELFFVDNSIFSSSDFEKISSEHLKRGVCAGILLEEAEKIETITNKLSHLNNWVTIQEVIEEFQDRKEYIEKLSRTLRDLNQINYFSTQKYSKNEQTHRNFLQGKGKRERYHQLKKAVKKIKRQRKRMLSILEQDFRNTTDYLTEELSDKINKILPKIENIFLGLGEIPNEKNTDCKLIATAIVYGEAGPFSIYSEDKGLLKTFAYAVRELPIAIGSPSIISQKTGKMPTEYYLRRFKLENKSPSQKSII